MFHGVMGGSWVDPTLQRVKQLIAQTKGPLTPAQAEVLRAVADSRDRILERLADPDVTMAELQQMTSANLRRIRELLDRAL